MNLRPHHLLCIQKFTGHGYSPEFTAHMTAVAARLRKMPETRITLTKGCDDLCRKCPHSSSGICSSLDKTAALDAAVQKICGLSFVDSDSWAALAENVREKILSSETFHHICLSCQWYELCRNTEVSYD